MQPLAALSRHREPLEAHLSSLLDAQQPSDLRRMLRYHMGWEEADGTPADHTGKRLRPSLCLMACEALGGEVSQALPIAAALELVHNFSLIHDDVQDRDLKRHGRDTVWAIWGEAQAINAGDALLAIAHRSMASAAEAGWPTAAAVLAAGLLAERTLEMVEGQVMDIDFEARTDVSQEEYLAMVSRKTGALFDASLALGAIAAGASLQTIEAMGRCGRSLGIAFQARDDALGVWGDESRTGKASGADIRRRKKSLPAIHAFSRADAGQREQLGRIYGRDDVSDADVEWVLRLMDSVGASQYCAGVADEHRGAALRELESAGLTPDGSAEIREVADFLLNRDY
jgi:geranylgeranyl diphosphate synthase type I